MVTIQDLRGSKCTDDEWYEYCQMPQVRANETPGEWKERIWMQKLNVRMCECAKSSR